MAHIERPFNPVTGEEYQGGNVDTLLTQAKSRGYTSNQFAGFGQWKQAGRTVRKGEKSLSIKQMGSFESMNVDTGKPEKGTFARVARVFAMEQTDPIHKKKS